MRPMDRQPMGHHVILDLHGCPGAALDDLDALRTRLLEAVRLSGATILNDVFHKFSPQGVTGVVVIAESHASVHTWPEHGFAAFDFFTCGARMNAVAAIRHLIEALQPQRFSVREVARGGDERVSLLPLRAARGGSRARRKA